MGEWGCNCIGVHLFGLVLFGFFGAYMLFSDPWMAGQGAPFVFIPTHLLWQFSFWDFGNLEI